MSWHGFHNSKSIVNLAFSVLTSPFRSLPKFSTYPSVHPSHYLHSIHLSISLSLSFYFAISLSMSLKLSLSLSLSFSLSFSLSMYMCMHVWREKMNAFAVAWAIRRPRCRAQQVQPGDEAKSLSVAFVLRSRPARPQPDVAPDEAF